jgi:hypothetical protein
MEYWLQFGRLDRFFYLAPKFWLGAKTKSSQRITPCTLSLLCFLGFLFSFQVHELNGNMIIVKKLGYPRAHSITTYLLEDSARRQLGKAGTAKIARQVARRQEYHFRTSL